jgi:RNA polymerase sigma-70 factor (ECF subfamily)
MKTRKGYSSTKYTTHDEDKKLVIEALGGNQRSYNVLVQKYKPILFTAAKRRLSSYSVEDLEDAVMVVMGTAFMRINQYDPTKSLFFTWIIACMHNYINNIPKQKKRIVADSLDSLVQVSENETIEYQVPDEDRFDLNMDREQVIKLIRLIVDKLPEKYSDIIKLRYFKELSYKEIAEELNCETSEVEYKLRLAKNKLKKLSEQSNLF